MLGERGYAVGDRVVALRRIGAATSATSGSVVAVGAGSVTVEWQGPTGPWRGEVGREHARSLGYGYATTVPYLRSFDQGTQRFVVLGDPLELATRSARAAAAWVTVPGPACRRSVRAGGGAAPSCARELATSWPDDEMLELAGPRPLGPAGRRRWAEVVVTCAIRRDLGLVNAGSMRMDAAHLGPGDIPHLDVAGRAWPEPVRVAGPPSSRKWHRRPQVPPPGRNVLTWRDLPVAARARAITGLGAMMSPNGMAE